jgi:hypothetical protein
MKRIVVLTSLLGVLIFSSSKANPAIASPWGMNFWRPMTSTMGDGWTYKYNEYKIRGNKAWGSKKENVPYSCSREK